MGDRTSIEWTRGDDGSPGATWNPIVGCSRVSPGCDHCYAIGVVHRQMAPQHVGLTVHPEGERVDWTGEVRVVEHLMDQPLRWQRPRHPRPRPRSCDRGASPSGSAAATTADDPTGVTERPVGSSP